MKATNALHLILETAQRAATFAPGAARIANQSSTGSCAFIAQYILLY